MPRGERPLGAGDSALLRFAADLRQLRRKAGSPTYRELAERAHYSVATLSSAANGQKLPSLAVTSAYVRACEGDVEEWERRWHEVAAELAAKDSAESADSGEPTRERSPYAGLAAFQLEDAEWFFGRERLVEELVIRLLRQRFVAVFGASGAGKSSLLRAGLLPRWLAGAEKRHVVLFTPGAHPLEECAIQLAQLSGGTPGRIRDELVADRRGLYRIVRQTLAGMSGHAELLLVVDQFEEAFTLCRDQDERGKFIDALITAAHDSDSRCGVVLGVRADFYAHCTSHAELVEVLRDAQVPVGPMTTDELRQAITQPAARAGCVVEGALLADLIAHANGQVGVLPLLSHALLETWHRRHGKTLTLAGFQAAGGIDGALAHTAETLYTSLEPAQQRRAKELFLRLTALGEGTEDTKRRIKRGELDTGSSPDTAAPAFDTDVVLERLTRERLLTVDRDSIEITHEALIRSWPRLHGWLTEDREGLRIHRQLTDAAGAWESVDRDPGALYRGTRLAVARDWAVARAATLAPREREFLEASRDAQAAEQAAARRRSRRLRQLLVLLTVLLALAVVASFNAMRAEQKATQQRNIATAQRAAERAAELRSTNPALAAQLSLAAYRLAPNTETRSSLLSTFASPYATRLTGHTKDLATAAYSPNGRTVATGGQDREVRLSDVSDPQHPRELAVLTGHTDAVNSVAYSPDGNTVATGGQDHSVRLWDVADPRHPRKLGMLTAHSDAVKAVVFAPDGRTLATASADHTVRLWDTGILGRPGQLTQTIRHADAVNAVAFAPDGRTLATAGADRSVRLWDVADPRHSRELAVHTGHTDAVNAVAFAPDGRTLASGSVDVSVRLWDVADPRHSRELTVLTGHTDSVNSVAFAADGRTLVTASGDHTARLWDIPGYVLAGHSSSVYGVAFGPDGRILATTSYDRTARLWDVADPRRPRELAVLTGHSDSVNFAAFSSDGRTLATASADNTVRLWDISDPRRPSRLASLRGHTDNVEAVVFGPGDRTLATAGEDHTARLWDVADPRNPRESGVLVGHTDRVEEAVFTPDGRTLVTASADRSVRLWDVTHPRHPRTLAVLTGHTDEVKSVVLAPDGHTLATASEDRTVRLWDLGDPRRVRQLAVLTGSTDGVKSVVFSPDGHTLAAASSDRTIRLWDTAQPRRPRPLATLTGHTKRVDAVAFSPNGHTIATGSEDQTALLWDVDPERTAARICRFTYPAITRPEWNQYLANVSYKPPC